MSGAAAFWPTPRYSLRWLTEAFRFLLQGICIVIVTIDGPAGAGKSSIARQVADRLGFEFLDTGALYRAVTYGAIEANVDLQDVEAVVGYVNAIEVRWENSRVFLEGEDVTGKIRTPEVTDAIRYLADPPPIRRQLSELQRQIADGRDIVSEGRDQGADVFPDAECKIFLTASPAVRARRRQQQLAESGKSVPYEEVLAAQNRRDLEDRMRPVGRLRAAPDAVVLSTDGMSPEEVLETVLEIVDAATVSKGDPGR